MTALIDLGTAVLVMAAWFFAAIGVALFFAALFHGAKYRDEEPESDLGEPTYREGDPWGEYLQSLADRKERVEERRRRFRSAA